MLDSRVLDSFLSDSFCQILSLTFPVQRAKILFRCWRLRPRRFFRWTIRDYSNCGVVRDPGLPPGVGTMFPEVPMATPQPDETELPQIVNLSHVNVETCLLYTSPSPR